MSESHQAVAPNETGLNTNCRAVNKIDYRSFYRVEVASQSRWWLHFDLVFPLLYFRRVAICALLIVARFGELKSSSFALSKPPLSYYYV